MKKTHLALYLAAATVVMGLKSETMNKEPIAFDASQVDRTTTPCDNFYRYSNGIWMDKNPVPATESRWSCFNVLTKENETKLQTILDEVLVGNHKKGTTRQLIGDFYKSALDSGEREKTGLAPLQPILNKIADAKSKADLVHLYPELIQMGVRVPVSVYVSRDRRNSEQYITSISQSGIGLPNRDYYLKTDEKFIKIREQYAEHINNIMKLSGNPAGKGAEILALETKIATAQWSITEQRDPLKTYNKRETKLVSEDYPLLNLNGLLQGVRLGAAEHVIVGQPTYFEALNKIITETSIEDWKSYHTWQVLGSFADHINDDFEKEDFRFYSTILRGTKEMKPRKERILNTINGMLGEPMGQLFVAKYFPESAKKYISTMIENLRSAYRESIMNLSWMGDTTKQKALKKLEAFTYKVGYPDEWKDYSKLVISPNGYLQNVINTRFFGYKMMTDKLGKPVDKKEWGMSPQTVNAYYSSSGNEIVFPAGILQPPFFHVSFDDAINYGGIGGVIGHEFTHGFDDQGSKYDGEGNLNNWWTDADRERFGALTKRLADQYSGYEPLPGMHINGEMTLGENIADLGGLTLAFAALKKQLAGKEPEAIDGYNWQQRFYLGWANVWKQTIREDELKNRLITDVHSPGEYRVLGPLANIKEFGNAFGCKDCKMQKAETEMIKIW